MGLLVAALVAALCPGRGRAAGRRWCCAVLCCVADWDPGPVAPAEAVPCLGWSTGPLPWELSGPVGAVGRGTEQFGEAACAPCGAGGRWGALVEVEGGG